MKPHWPQHERLADFVIAQQYSSATFVLPGFHFRKKKKYFGAHFT
jgi:hypothetical protein